MDILATNIHGMTLDVCQSLLGYIEEEKQDKIRRFRHPEDALRSFFGELLIRVYAVKSWGIPYRACILQTNEYGKPYLVKHPRHEFNVSHSGAWVVAGFDESPIGVDIEQIVPINISVADQFFSKEEVKPLGQQPCDQRLQHFYRLWTLKESYIKAVGKGLSIPLNSFSFNVTENPIRFQSNIDSHDWRFRRYFIDPEYELAVCSYGLEAMSSDHVQVISAQAIISLFEEIVESS